MCKARRPLAYSCAKLSDVSPGPVNTIGCSGTFGDDVLQRVALFPGDAQEIVTVPVG